MSHKKAFTLAEVLIALALLGVVAAFAVPKILQSTQQADRKAQFKSSITTLNEILYKAALNDEFATKSPFDIVKAHANTLQTCTDMVAQGCSPVFSNGLGSTPVTAVVLANGSSIIGLSPNICTQPSCVNTILIDWNGPRQPQENAGCCDYATRSISLNRIAYIEMQFDYGRLNATTSVADSAPDTVTPGGSPKPLPPGSLLPSNEWAHETLYNMIFIDN